MNYGNVVANIRTEFNRYMNRNNLECAVIGISGGIDSAVVAALLGPTCTLIGKSLPIESNKQDEIDRAYTVGKAFCTEFAQEDLTNAFHSMCRILKISDSDNDKIRRGNVKARIRMIDLFDCAKKNNGLVLSTDNFTELLLGFWTEHGDVGNYGPIQNLWKTEVYELADYLTETLQTKEYKNALNSCILAIPTDGLGVSDSDLDQIFPDWKKYAKTHREAFEQVDAILDYWTNTKNLYTDKELANNAVIKRHIASEHKRNDPVNISRLVLER